MSGALLADECVDQQIVAALRLAGHDVVSIAELSPSISDEEVLETARQQSRLLITADKDFGELIFRQSKSPAGVLLLRISELDPEAKSALVLQVLASHLAEISGQFAVVGPKSLRIRRAP